MGEAIDWYFTSKREGGIKRKLTSNTRLSNIFREFCKGSVEERHPVAVLIFWTSNIERSDASLATEVGTGRRAEVSGSTPYQRQEQDLEQHNGFQEHRRRPNRQKQHQRQQQQQGTAIRHLTARELHYFLFGAEHGYHKLPAGATSHLTKEAAADGRGEEQTDTLFETKTRGDSFNEIRPDQGNRARTLTGSHGSVEFTWPRTENSGTRHSEISKAAARAAGAEAGDVSSGGWCLLQKFIDPVGSKISTLRCLKKWY
ncbi:unnamed protein product [Hapterophycus canaliculatus]